MDVRLYTIPGSHPGVAVQLMLKRKGIEFKRTDLFPVFSRLIVRGLRFPGPTVPAIKIDGRRVQGSLEIARVLEQLQPEPPLFPADPEKRAAVEEAERFGSDELQHPIRQIIWWAFGQNSSPLRSYSEGARLGIPIGLAVRTAGPIIALDKRIHKATDENVRANLAAYGGMLQRVDDMIAAGVLDGEELNAADFQIGPSLRLAMTMQDLRPLIEARPAGRLAKRVQPEIAGDFPPVLPPAWLQPLRSAPAAA
ncbi:MAG TPA: glutathione S-transferase N-terminal domain-containing protein [Solirubrobacterales bacterium]|nr:glutathione S-transferase N-terminal domain-containing protein [Solirubrobacterales bacterium]